MLPDDQGVAVLLAAKLYMSSSAFLSLRGPRLRTCHCIVRHATGRPGNNIRSKSTRPVRNSTPRNQLSVRDDPAGSRHFILSVQDSIRCFLNISSLLRGAQFIMLPSLPERAIEQR